MNTIKTILVPVNFTKTSINAMQSAITMSRQHGATLHLLNVLETDFMIPTADMSLPVLNQTAEIQLSRVNNLKRYTEAITSTYNVDCSFSIETGSVPSAICSKAHELNASLIVMGTDDTHNIFSHFFYGSTAYRVLQKTMCPLLTIPVSCNPENFSNIVFPVRPVSNSLQKYQFLKTLIPKSKASLYVFAALDVRHPENFNALKVLMESAVEDISGTISKVEHEYYVGDNIAKAALDKGKHLNADLIVITASITKSIKRFFNIEYVRQIIDNHNTPVLSIKPGFT